jgi:signal recognition particle subunit SRP72
LISIGRLSSINFIATQILLEKGEVNDAIKFMEDNLPMDIKFSAGVLSALVTLCLAVEKRPKAAQLLKEAVLNMKGNSKNRSTDMSTIWRKTAEFHLKGDEPSVASQSLEELLKVDPTNVQTLAQLVLAYAKYDLKKALAASKKLPKFNEQSKIDVDVLESSSFVSAKYGKKTPKPGDPVTPKQPSESPINADETLTKKKKRKHKKRLPKNYDLNVDPDPERWTPRRERIGYRRKS